jgi:hypothetical protein
MRAASLPVASVAGAFVGSVCSLELRGVAWRFNVSAGYSTYSDLT